MTVPPFLDPFGVGDPMALVRALDGEPALRLVDPRSYMVVGKGKRVHLMHPGDGQTWCRRSGEPTTKPLSDRLCGKCVEMETAERERDEAFALYQQRIERKEQERLAKLQQDLDLARSMAGPLTEAEQAVLDRALKVARWWCRGNGRGWGGGLPQVHLVLPSKEAHDELWQGHDAISVCGRRAGLSLPDDSQFDLYSMPKALTAEEIARIRDRYAIAMFLWMEDEEHDWPPVMCNFCSNHLHFSRGWERAEAVTPQ